MKNKNKQSGFIALYTVLLASVILLMVVGITRISYKEIVLSRVAQESDLSFFAADRGVECALYHDRAESAFPVSATASFATSLTCGGVSGTVTKDDPGDTQYRFKLAADSWCADVRIDKGFEDEGGKYKKIESFGYNKSCEEVGISPLVVERALRVTYPLFSF